MNVVLIYYSNTGRMESFTKQLADEYLKQDVKVTSYSMDSYNEMEEVIDFSKENTLFGFGFPYHEMKPPREVDVFLSLLKNYYKRIPVFLYTSGSRNQSDSNYTVIRELTEKNYYTIGNFEVLCTDNCYFENSNIDTEVLNNEQVATFVERTVNLFEAFCNHPFVIHEDRNNLKELLKAPIEYIKKEVYHKKIRQETTCIRCGKCLGSKENYPREKRT